MKYLTVCADDFAASEGISQGIARLAGLGRISATSAMVLSPRWAEDAALLQEVRGHIDVGLHLDWTSAFAHAAGHGLSLRGAMLKAVMGGFDQAAARAVIERQLDAFEAVWKGPPDHIDGHQHVQQFAGIRQALVAAVRERYAMNNRAYFRLSMGAKPDSSFKTKVIAGLGAAALAGLAKTAGIASAPALSGIYDFSGGAQRYAQLMAHWLHEAPEGAILMCHPAAWAEAGDEIGAARAWEYAYLAGDAFPQALASAGVILSRGAQLHLNA
ncbi:ChbG/HpnK family deacetylase [Polaromonas jejuensis]|uniref:ChbG/HpnK family deacetylase n=1 Tax=Polaromonas jejuensis TaxID=457502 RepID=A0ABW0Q620_9BURK|nr:ChbG/HpnK family deacetylase [Polaromonas jejuensis]